MSSPVSLESFNDSLNGTGSVESNKKLPPNKVLIGVAKGPNLKNVKSKIGSLNNVRHKPTGGDKKIESQKLNWNTKSRVGSLENTTHKPKGGSVKVVTQKLEWNVKSKVGSLDNVKHVPGGGSVKIFDEKYSSSTMSQNSSARSGHTTPSTNTTPMNSNRGNHNQVEDLLKETQEKLTLKSK